MSATNEVTGKAYAGNNVVRLLEAEIIGNYDESRGWAGFQQWRTVGRTVRRGQHGVRIVQVGVSTTTDADGKVTTRSHPGRGRPVFHYDQTEPIDAAPAGGYVRDPGEDAADRWAESQRY